ncbi:lipopolysaccharide heptosyltransferase i [hydrocarbon metagenome]|uniref:lipopolysaccharide heptosyltransferase II n=1 Tax=hydrocarbon metagenome TaxID=938273 RepID=A0A0W8FT14_9ZZZZ
MNILIVKLSAIGDVIHTLPSLAALRRLYPESHITWVVEEAAADLVTGHPYLDSVLVSRRKSWSRDLLRGRVRSPLSEIGNFVRKLRQRDYDLVIDFHGLFKSSIIVFLSRGKRKLGYDSWQEISGLFLNEKIPEDVNKHAVDRYLDFPRYLGAEIDRVEFTLPSDKNAEEKVLRLLREYNLEDKKFVAINPIALWETKLWSDEQFACLADLINNKLQVNVVFTGSEKESIEKITSLMNTECVNLGGKTTLLDLACLYKKACMVITTDSGPMHMAAAVGIPVIALFGPTDPERTGPYGDGHTIIRIELPCSPCFLKKCSTKQCMKDISSEQVFAVVEKKLIKEQ